MMSARADGRTDTAFVSLSRRHPDEESAELGICPTNEPWGQIWCDISRFALLVKSVFGGASEGGRGRRYKASPARARTMCETIERITRGNIPIPKIKYPSFTTGV